MSGNRTTQRVAAGILAATAFFAQSSRAADRLSVDGELINIEIIAPIPVDEAIRQLADALNVPVAGSAGPGETGPIRLTRAGLMEVLRKLAPGRSFVVEMAGKPPLVSRIVFAGAGRAATGLATPHAPPSATPGTNATLRNIAKLSYVPGRVSARQLEEMALRGGATEIRIAALHALGQFAGHGSIPFLGRRLTGDSDPRIRLAAAEALHIAGTSRATALIATAAAGERDSQLRQKFLKLAGE